MTKIEAFLKNSIKSLGSITLKDFLNVVLYHERFGYYSKENIIGKKGDFITAPEISQVFGEIICYSLLLSSNKLEQTKSMSLVELGPGRGFLIQDILRTLKKLNLTLYQKIKSIFFLENYKKYLNYLKNVHTKTIIIDDIGKIPDNYNIIFANEFFDALPVRQYIYKKKKWHEILITLNSAEKFIFSTAKEPVRINYFFPEDPVDNYTFEYSEYMINILSFILKKIEKYGGVFFIIDYDRDTNQKDATLSSIKNHKKTGIFDDLGNCDISHSPDFSLIEKVCKNYKCSIFGPHRQSVFLQKYGINERIDYLIKKNTALSNELLLQKERLIGKKFMGDIFKVMIITDQQQKYNFF